MRRAAQRLDVWLLTWPLWTQRAMIAPVVLVLSIVNAAVEARKAFTGTWQEAYSYLHDRNLRDERAERYYTGSDDGTA